MNPAEVLAAVQERARGFSGRLGLWAHSLTSGTTVRWNASETFPAASTIKLPILYEVFRQAGEGRFRLDDRREVRDDDLVEGSGVLKDLTPPLQLSIRDLAVLMIVVSDNTAANVLIDLVGIEAVNRSMSDLGLRKTRLEARFFRAPAGTPRSATTPEELGRLLTLIAGHEVLDAEACEGMLAILRRQRHTEQITRRMADFDGYVEAGAVPAVTVASKSGAIRGTRNDVGLVERPGLRYVVAMMTRDCADRRFYPDNEASLLLADVAAIVDGAFRGGL